MGDLFIVACLVVYTHDMGDLFIVACLVVLQIISVVLQVPMLYLLHFLRILRSS